MIYCWEVAEFNILNQQAHALLQRMTQLVQHRLCDRADILKKTNFESYIKGVFKKRRTPAKHVLVLMASDETRRSKPYAIPIKYIPYQSIKDQYLRDVTGELKQRLMAHGITTVGKD